jgi:suppressor of G2 allele of SKP1
MSVEPAALFSAGNLLYVKEEYEEALKHYTCAVALDGTCSDYHSCRAATYLKLGKFDEALKDAEAATQVDPMNHTALHWKGVAHFYLSNFVAAKAAFEESARSAPRAARSRWIRKCDAELSGSTLPLGGIAAETSLPTVGTAAPVAVETPAPRAESAQISVEETAAAPASLAPASASLTISGRKPPRREWYQSSTHVIITIFLKGAAQDDCKAEFHERDFSLSVKLPGSETETYNLDLELAGAIDPSGCKVEASKVKVEVTLLKKYSSRWDALEKVEEQAVSDQPAYPSSSKQKRDWSQIDRDMETELKSDKPEGDEALNTLFREIYGKADPETRRAMNKSFQTSGGTVLSTNWGEVAKADYEGKDRPSPPDGQDWKDWRNK